jgi:hypothetical protein
MTSGAGLSPRDRQLPIFSALKPGLRRIASEVRFIFRIAVMPPAVLFPNTSAVVCCPLRKFRRDSFLASMKSTTKDVFSVPVARYVLGFFAVLRSMKLGLPILRTVML